MHFLLWKLKGLFSAGSKTSAFQEFRSEAEELAAVQVKAKLLSDDGCMDGPSQVIQIVVHVQLHRCGRLVA